MNLAIKIMHNVGFPGGSEGKESAYNAEDLVLILESGRCPGGGHGNPLQDSCLERIPRAEEPGGATVHGAAKSRTRLSDSQQLMCG